MWEALLVGLHCTFMNGNLSVCSFCTEIYFYCVHVDISVHLLLLFLFSMSFEFQKIVQVYCCTEHTNSG